MHGMMKKMPGPRAPPRRNRPSLVVICIFTIIAVIFIIIQFITFIIILVIIIMTMFKCLEVIIFFPPEYNRSLVLLHHLPDYDYHGASDDDDDLDDDDDDDDVLDFVNIWKCDYDCSLVLLHNLPNHDYDGAYNDDDFDDNELLLGIGIEFMRKVRFNYHNTDSPSKSGIRISFKIALSLSWWCWKGCWSRQCRWWWETPWGRSRARRGGWRWWWWGRGRWGPTWTS